MFDIIAIDWGSVRFGLAFGSSLTELIIPCSYDCYTTEIWQTLQLELETRKTQKAIIGIPTTFDLKPTKVTNQILVFIKEFESKFPNIEVITANERESTKKALLKNRQVTKHSLNHNSACEILKLGITK
jgi:RNase H-fold protein (predicted Holliday junction resolvase)